MNISELLPEGDAPLIERIDPGATLKRAAKHLINGKIGALVVTDEEDHLVGILSERDLVPIVAEASVKACQRPVSAMMTRDVITCQPEDEIGAILTLMNVHGIRHMPVINDEVLVGMVSIRQLTRAYDLLKIEANTDPLTQLSNRRSFLNRLEHECSRARRFSHPMTVAMLDLDHFKSVNDTYGHDAGDEVLRRVSALMISEFRTIDLVGRLGGEEFAFIFPETDLEGAVTACERLRKRIKAETFVAEGTQFHVTASLGVVKLTPEKADGAALLKCSDILLYRAKAEGRNRVEVEDLPQEDAQLRIVKTTAA